MANVKITELTAATALAGTDVLPIVDVGADATKKVSVSDLLRNLPDGTASAPALAFADDQNTGVLSPGNNTLAFATSGTQRLVIDSSGNVGIGDAAPSEKLNVAGNVMLEGGDQYLYLTNVGTGNSGIYIRGNTSGSYLRSHSTGIFTWEVTGSEKMRLDSSGRLGIGTSSPQFNLQTQNGGFDDRGSNNGVAIRNNIYYSSGDKYLTASGAASTQYFDGSGNIIFYNTGTASTGAGNSVSLSERLRLDSSGRLLVGASTARSKFFNNSSLYSGKLQVEGTSESTRIISLVHNTSNSNFPIFVLGKSRGTSAGSHTVVQNGDGLGSLSFQGADGSELVEAASIKSEVDGTPGSNDMPGRLVFSTSADGASSTTERMRIDKAGQISLYSEGNSARTTVKNAGTAAGSSAFDINNNATSTTTGTQVFSIRENGDIYTSGNTTVQSLSSERRLKENIEVIDPATAWTTIKNTPYYSYNYIGQEGPRYGPIVDEVPADMVRDTDLSDDQGPIRTFDNGMLHARLYSALQQAIAKIETLEAKVAALEAQ